MERYWLSLSANYICYILYYIQENLSFFFQCTIKSVVTTDRNAPITPETPTTAPTNGSLWKRTVREHAAFVRRWEKALYVFSTKFKSSIVDHSNESSQWVHYNKAVFTSNSWIGKWNLKVWPLKRKLSLSIFEWQSSLPPPGLPTGSILWRLLSYFFFVLIQTEVRTNECLNKIDRDIQKLSQLLP